MIQTELIVGDTLQFETAVPDYPAVLGYALTYRLVPRAGGAPITISATAAGNNYAVNVAAATTAAWTPGDYAWAAYVSLAGARYTVGTGQITLRPDPGAMAAGTDTRTQAERALADLKAALAAWTPTRKSYQVGDVAMTFNSSADILQLISYWERQVLSEKAAAALARGLANPNKVYVRTARA